MYNILVCDDEKDIVSALKIYLESEGYAVECAYDGAQALALLESRDISLVLMDIMMPVMDGYTATRQIRALGDPALAKIPILAMTANAFDEDRRNALESGMTGFLSKPIVIGDLVQELRKIL